MWGLTLISKINTHSCFLPLSVWFLGFGVWHNAMRNIHELYGGELQSNLDSRTSTHLEQFATQPDHLCHADSYLISHKFLRRQTKEYETVYHC